MLFQYYVDKAQAVLLEKSFDDLLLEMIKSAKYLSFGIEPVLGFLIAKELEIKNLRQILIGKLRHVPSELIQKSVRKTYV